MKSISETSMVRLRSVRFLLSSQKKLKKRSFSSVNPAVLFSNGVNTWLPPVADLI